MLLCMLKELDEALTGIERVGAANRQNIEEKVAAVTSLMANLPELFGPLMHGNVPEARARGRAELDKMADAYTRAATAYANAAQAFRDFAGE